MDEELRLPLADLVQPSPRSVGSGSQSFELAHRPSMQVRIDARLQEEQLGAVVGPVIVDPPSHLGIDLPRESRQARADATVEVPSPDLHAFRLLRIVAHSRKEAYEEALPATATATPEGIAQEVEAGVLVTSSASRIFAIHDLRLVGVQLETQGPEPLGDSSPQCSGLPLRVAMGDHIICVALERTARELPVHPTIERIMHAGTG